MLRTIFTPTAPELTPAWRTFFENHATVLYVETLEAVDGTEDVTVFFTDSDEPFPLTSLNSSSELRQELENLLYED